jgi:lysozyme
MKINEQGLALVKHFEGCSLTAYLCPAGVWTIGYGSTGNHVRKGGRITKEAAELLLMEDLHRTELAVMKIIGNAPTNHHQFSALVSFAFNLGPARLDGSTLMKRHRNRDYNGAAVEFLRWNKMRVDGQLVASAGLTRRRLAESALYSHGSWQ